MPQNLGADAQYDGYRVVRFRHRRKGVAQMPVAGPDPQASVIVALGAATEVHVVVYAARRLGAPPVVPAEDPPNANYVLHDAAQWGESCVGLGGVMEYTVSGYALYLLNAPEGLGSDLPLARMPWRQDGDERIPAANFDTTILYSAANPTLAPPVTLPRQVTGG